MGNEQWGMWNGKWGMIARKQAVVPKNHLKIWCFGLSHRSIFLMRSATRRIWDTSQWAPQLKNGYGANNNYRVTGLARKQVVVSNNIRIMGLAGTFASGKDTLADYLVAHKNFYHVSTGDIIREESMKLHGSTDRVYLREVANQMRSERGPGPAGRLRRYCVQWHQKSRRSRKAAGAWGSATLCRCRQKTSLPTSFYQGPWPSRCNLWRLPEKWSARNEQADGQ